jgi:hypothetical protein
MNQTEDLQITEIIRPVVKFELSIDEATSV